MKKNIYVKPMVEVYTVACNHQILAGSGDPKSVSGTVQGTATSTYADSRDGSMWDDDDNE